MAESEADLRCSEVRVRARVFLCMLAYYAEWHMRRRLAPLLFDEDDPEAVRAQRASPVEPAKPSPSARSKAARKRTQGGETAHSFHSLLANLSTVALNDVSLGDSSRFTVVTTPTPGQRKAFELLNANPAKMFPTAGRWKSANRVADNGKLRFFYVKFSLVF